MRAVADTPRSDRSDPSDAQPRWLLAPLAVPYALLLGLRNRYYDQNAAAIRSADLPVISVGNITTGGTGKTPIVIELVRRLQQRGRRPAILTRGYGGRVGAEADEVLEFRSALSEVPVVVDADRVAGATTALSQFGADVLVMDDGFQHRRLHRDLDVVLVDALCPWGAGWVLPAGRLREPLRGLRRADLFIITRANQVAPQQISDIQSVIRRYHDDARITSADVAVESVRRGVGRTDAPDELAYRAVMPVCGIGNPTTFLRCVEHLAGRVCPPIVYRDHHRYTRRDVDFITRQARRGGGDLVLTTRKDWVKLEPLWRRDAAEQRPELAWLEVRLSLSDDEGIVGRALDSALNRDREST